MKLELRSKGIRMTARLSEHIERRLAFALGRFADRVQRVHLQLTDVNGPRGGDDIRCTIRARYAPGGELVIQETRSDPFAAVALASDRIGHGIARQVERLRRRRRRQARRRR